jgi:hypothetical protein
MQHDFMLQIIEERHLTSKKANKQTHKQQLRGVVCFACLLLGLLACCHVLVMLCLLVCLFVGFNCLSV